MRHLARLVHPAIGIVCALALGLGILTSSAAADDGAAKLFDEGKQLLTRGEFDQALQSFARAAELDAARQEYRQAASILKQVVALREQLPSVTDAGRWERNTRALRAYYVEQGIRTETLALDRRFHERFNTAESAELLAESLLESGEAAEAQALLSARQDGADRLGTGLLLGIALARQDRMAEARELAGRWTVPADATPENRIRAARLQSLSGNTDQAMSLLTAAFEGTPPSQLESVKARVKTCPDFGPLSAGDAFARVLGTASKVQESNCSSGSNCGACPSRTSCGKTAAAKPAGSH